MIFIGRRSYSCHGNENVEILLLPVNPNPSVKEWQYIIGHCTRGNSPNADKSDNLNAIMSLTNNITTCMALATCNSANNHHFLHHGRLFQSRSELLAPSCLPVITSHQQGRRKRLEGGGGVAHPSRRGEPKGASILIKGLGAEPRLKIETEGDWHRFLQALTARLTAAPRRRAVEPSRESARLPMMR